MQWDIESEYKSIEATEFSSDEKRIQELTQAVTRLTDQIRPLMTEKTSGADLKLLVEGLQNILILDEEVLVLRSNLGTYINCLLSVNASDKTANAKDSQLTALGSQYSQAIKPVMLFMTRCEDEVFTKVIEHPKLQSQLFAWKQERTKRDTLLSEKEEILLTSLHPSGMKAWGDLYDSISGTIKARVEQNGKVEELGLAQASAMTKGRDAGARKAAWQGIQQAWRTHEEAAASILNSLAGWRLEVCKKRSHTRPISFMETPLFQSRIQKETLDAMLTAVQNNVKDIQAAALLMAKMHGKPKLDPWDLLAPAPLASAPGKLSFEDGISQIRTAFLKISPELGKFVDMMVEKRWIDDRVLPNKTNGAFCTGFVKSQTPRVFMTYMGSNQDVSTLAHELGHAYHSWVMRDLPLAQQDYPMTLAETASIFAETVLADELVKNAKTKEEKLDFAWSDVEGAVSFLINIPARYEFEHSFYKARQDKVLSADDLRDLTDKAWNKWYGPSLSETDKMFWATKLHFSISSVSFYNYPYTFGYLFALSIYARRKELGDSFMPKYIEILRDTGRMTAEELVMKHLGEDIRNPQFWQKSIDVVKEKIQNFKDLAFPN